MDLNRQPFDKKKLENKKVVLYFWATWCGVCKLNHSFFKTNYSTFKDNPEVFVLSIEEGGGGIEAVKEYSEKNNIPYPIIIANETFLMDWKIQAFPTTIFLNSKGEVKFVDTGIINPVSFSLRMWLLKFL